MPVTSQGAQVTVDLERTIAPISPLLFGGFAEHMGRCTLEDARVVASGSTSSCAGPTCSRSPAWPRSSM